MTVAWIMAIGAGVANAAAGLGSKAAQHTGCRTGPYGLIALGVASLMALGLAARESEAWLDGRLWLFGVTMGVLFLCTIACMLQANRVWSPSLVWSTANMGFIVPILASAAFLGEPLCWLDTVILAGFALMLIGLSSGTKGKDSPEGAPRRRVALSWALIAGVFVTNGLMMFGYKLFATVLPDQRPACLVATMYGSGALAALLLSVAAGGSLRVTRVEAGCGLGAGVAIGVAALALVPAMQLPAAVAFPIIQGTSLAGGVLLCAMIFHERLTARKLLALAAGLGTMALTCLR